MYPFSVLIGGLEAAEKNGVSSATNPEDALHYCIPCEGKYLQETDISVTCHQVRNATSKILTVEVYGKQWPCIPCHSDFTRRNLTEICDDLISHTQTTEPNRFEVDIPESFYLDEFPLDTLVEECLLYNNEVLFEGVCEPLFSNASCPKGEWLVLVNETAMYVEQPCPFAQILLNGSCVDARDSSVCGGNQTLLANLDGSADCVCDDGFAMNLITGECLFRHSQGPCAETWYVEKMIDDQAACVPDLCKDYSMVYLDGKCLGKNPDEGLCIPEYYSPTSNTTAKCNPPLNSIFSGGSLISCPAGQQKTPSGGCREIFKFRQKNFW